MVSYQVPPAAEAWPSNYFSNLIAFIIYKIKIGVNDRGVIESGLNDKVKCIGVKKHVTSQLLNKLTKNLIRFLKYSFSTKLISKVLAFN